MNRRSLIKSILALAAAPKILAEMYFTPPLKPKTYNVSGTFLRDLKTVTPDCLKDMSGKYALESYTIVMNEIGKIKPMNEGTICYEGIIKKLQAGGCI